MRHRLRRAGLWFCQGRAAQRRAVCPWADEVSPHLMAVVPRIFGVISQQVLPSEIAASTQSRPPPQRACEGGGLWWCFGSAGGPLWPPALGYMCRNFHSGLNAGDPSRWCLAAADVETEPLNGRERARSLWCHTLSPSHVQDRVRFPVNVQGRCQWQGLASAPPTVPHDHLRIILWSPCSSMPAHMHLRSGPRHEPVSR